MHCNEGLPSNYRTKPGALGRRPDQGGSQWLGHWHPGGTDDSLVILPRIDGTDVWGVREGFTKTLRHVPAPLGNTLIYDRGKEMAEHERLAE